MKKENKFKLAMINVLSNPDIEVSDINIENGIETISGEFPSIWEQKVPTGISRFTITIYNPKNDRHKPTEK